MGIQSLRSLATVTAIVVSFSAAVAVSGCGGSGNDAVATAQVAVRANPALELVATDQQQGVLTVRIRHNGRVLTVRADDVVAGTAFRDLELTALPSAPSAPALPPAPAVATSPATSPLPDPTLTPRMVPAEPQTAPVPERAPAPVQAPPPPAAPASTEGATLNLAALKPRSTPVQCSGVETVRLDGVHLVDAGTAVRAIGECRVFITNSHIKGRVAVQAMGNAAVTIENSVVEGTVAIQASQTSVTTARGSTFVGRVQKLQSGVVRDLGRNVWR